MVTTMLAPRVPTVIVSLLMASIGCSGGTTGPLVGSWEGSTALESGLTIQYQITFHADNTMEIDDTVVYPADSLSMARCTEQDQATGFTWALATIDGGVPILTVNQNNAYQQTVYSNCANPCDDVAIDPMPNPDVLDGSPFGYVLMGNTLTLTPMGIGGGVLVLMRR